MAAKKTTGSLLREKKEYKMTDQTINRIRQFVKDRDWGQYHSPANLAKSISIEANELLECFLLEIA